MTDADAILRQYLANGEMAQHNPELLRPSRHPALRAVTVQELDARPKQSSLETSMQAVIDTALSQFPATEQPETEYRFHGLRRWRFDFAWPGRMLAVEVEGGQWVNGRHQRGKGYEDDCEKYNTAALMGWRVLRFTGDMVKDGRALATLLAALEAG